ncbi:MAG TPA: O-antigen ligase family protein, partial [Candidatus Saccharimonadales bacterium]|nr:O-antigen ligase family protein [Candidatus Saccharimonadales bacterium]
MKASTTVNKLTDRLSWLVVAILVLLPFHAFLTVWLSSVLGHYTLLRLWKEFLLVPIVVGALYIVFKDKQLRGKLAASWLIRVVGMYGLLILVWAFIPLARHDVSAKAMWYGVLVDLRFLAFFLSVLILATKSQLLDNIWTKIVLLPAILVTAFAILQYLALPYDFLKHFGYGPSTIEPYETINHNIQHIRVASTLRGANPLGAYLILPVSVLTVLLIKNKTQRKDGIFLGTGFLLALIFSFSRSAWISVALSCGIIIWTLVKNNRAKKILLWTLAGIVVSGGILAVTLRNNANFQNTFLHTENNSKIAESSNYGHRAAFRRAANDIFHHPLGHGVGAAGPESVYNKQPARIAENYFLQIAQEAGIIGALLFIAICVGIARLLWQQRSDPLALCLFASLIGISF